VELVNSFKPLNIRNVKPFEIYTMTNHYSLHRLLIRNYVKGWSTVTYKRNPPRDSAVSRRPIALCEIHSHFLHSAMIKNLKSETLKKNSSTCQDVSCSYCMQK